METTTRSESSVRFEAFELNLCTRELYRDGSRLKIRGHPIDVLAILLEHPGELVTRETLQKQLWPDDTFVDFEQILNNSIGKLRDALGDRAESPRYIETLPRLGYRFIAPVEKGAGNNHAAQIPAIAEAQPATPISTITSRPHRISTHWILWPSVALVGAFAAFAYWYLRLPLPAPRITHYEQLTLDGRVKVALGTDGTRIYLSLVPTTGIAQIPVSGGKVTEIPIELPSGPAPWFCSGVSPDGTNLLVLNTDYREEKSKLWVVNTSGRPARYLVQASAAAWSPDGKTVAYADEHGDVYTIASDGGEPRLLHRLNTPVTQTTWTRDMSWSPDGRTIRFSRWEGRIWEIGTDGADLHEWLPGWNGGVRKCCGQWTPDGQFFVFLAGRTLAKGPNFWPLGQIWAVDERHGRMRLPNRQPILLASGPLLWGHPVPSRDGNTIFARGVSLRGELERFDPASKRWEPYLGGISAEMTDFSRDGKYVAYVSFPDGILWRANRDGSGLVQLTEPPFYPRNPRWSPDGTQIIFTDNTASGVDTAYVVSSQGGIPKRLLPDDPEPQSVPYLSPDGKMIVYTTHPGFSFVPRDVSKIETRIVELSTGRVTVLPQRPGGFWAPEWSPDGRYIAGHTLDADQLVEFDLKTQTWRTLFTGRHSWHGWSHDGRFLYFHSASCVPGGGRGVCRVPAQGGNAELVAENPQNFRSAGWYNFFMRLDPDDAPLLIRDVGTDEIYALTLERK